MTRPFCYLELLFLDLVNRITGMIEPSLEALGYRIVQIKLQERGKSTTLSIMAERQDDQMMSFDDCADISRTVSALMDVEDPIAGAYSLEVMSPGIDRPLTRLEDFERFAGFEAKIELMIPQDGRKRFRGEILGVVGRDVSLRQPEGEYLLPFSQVKAAKLVLTDALMDAHLKQLEKKKPAGAGA